MTSGERIGKYEGPAGGWGSVKSLATIMVQTKALPRALSSLNQQNKNGGVACVSCAWAKPAHSHVFEFCENGAKATAWELTPKRVDAAFFARHTLTELRTWKDYDLEAPGRLTDPLRYDADTDRYLPVSWARAFADIGDKLAALAPTSTVFYASGRASLESSYMYQLLARMYGNNNLPDSSNMCHETTSVALPESIGVPIGTVHLSDFDATDCVFFFGQNVGSNSPRMLHDLQLIHKRGAPIISFNPLRERGLEEFKNPQAPLEMLHPGGTPISSQYHQVKIGGDIAALIGICKAVLALDDAALAAGAARVLDVDFIKEHTHGFDEFFAYLRESKWDELCHHAGLTQAALEDAAAVYARAKAVIGIYGMGLTQHHGGVQSVQMLVNLLLMRGNIGKLGAGICPVRGHSNVQGQRTVGITEKPELAPLDRLAEQYGFEPPREKGMNTVAACEGVIKGKVRAFVGLGGNFLRAVPDTDAIEAAWPGLDLTVHIATKLNRTHLLPGKTGYLLPCLGRMEIDRQASGQQDVTVEDSTARIHGSRALAEPVATTLLSEPAIVAGIALAIPKVAAIGAPWREWVGDYAKVRDAIEQTWPDIFAQFNARMWESGGFPRPNKARERTWNTKTGLANFHVPRDLSATLQVNRHAPDVLQLATIRSNDQFNTTIYGYDDRFRGIKGTRRVVLMNRADIARFGLRDGQDVSLSTAVDDGVVRTVAGLRVTAYDIPEGCVASYYPECNPLVPLWHHATGSDVPAAKSIPVRIGVTA
jgi:molybdopterin-dependent oxidoreductase alpha subunit